MIRLENSRHFLNQPDANLKINCDFVTRAFPRFKLYACFLFKFSLVPRTFSFLLVDCRDYYASAYTGPSIKKCLVSFWEIPNITKENLKDLRRIPRMFLRIPRMFRRFPRMFRRFPRMIRRISRMFRRFPIVAYSHLLPSFLWQVRLHPNCWLWWRRRWRREHDPVRCFRWESENTSLRL